MCLHAQAIAATGKIVKSNPKHLEALQLRGMAYMYLGDHDLAKRHFGEHLNWCMALYLRTRLSPDLARAERGITQDSLDLIHSNHSQISALSVLRARCCPVWCIFSDLDKAALFVWAGGGCR